MPAIKGDMYINTHCNYSQPTLIKLYNENIGGHLTPLQSTFKSSVRTNNDVEGWHNRLNHRSCQGQLDIYQSAPLLHQAEFVSVQALLVSDAKLHRHQCKEWDSWNFPSVLYSLVEALKALKVRSRQRKFQLWNFRCRLRTFAPSSVRLESTRERKL